MDQILLWGGVGCFGLMGLSFTLMAPELEAVPGISVAAGLLFWGPLLLGTVSQTALAIRRNRWLRSMKRRFRHHRAGIFSFFRTPMGTAADVGMLVSGAAFGLSLVLTHSTGLVCYFLLSLLVFFFANHCIFNGKSYNYIQYFTKKNEPKYVRRESVGTRRKNDDEEQNHKA